MITLIAVYIISFLFIFVFVYRENQKEPREEKLNPILVFTTAALLSLPPTIFVGLVLLALLGSANVIDVVFALDISLKQLMTLVIILFIYLFSLDGIFETIFELIVGKGKFYFVLVLLMRVFVFNVIARLIGISQTNSFILAFGIAVIIMILEMLYHYGKKS